MDSYWQLHWIRSRAHRCGFWISTSLRSPLTYSHNCESILLHLLSNKVFTNANFKFTVSFFNIWMSKNKVSLKIWTMWIIPEGDIKFFRMHSYQLASIQEPSASICSSYWVKVLDSMLWTNFLHGICNVVTGACINC